MRLLILVFFFAPALSMAVVNAHTTVQKGVSLYSQYYPNPTAHFKGTVVFINGSGMSSSEWMLNTHFFNCVTKKNSVFLYDRSGLGGSPPNLNLSPSNTNDARLIDTQLWTLLKKQHIPEPYLIVAHSYGGLYGGYFVLRYPQSIKGVLMIDPSPREYQFTKKVDDEFAQLANDAKQHTASYMVDHYSGPYVEVAYLNLGFEATKAQIKNLGAIKDHIPVIVISSTQMEYEDKTIQGDRLTLQKQWLNKNVKSRIFMAKSGHCIQIDEPDMVCRQINLLGQ